MQHQPQNHDTPITHITTLSATQITSAPCQKASSSRVTTSSTRCPTRAQHSLPSISAMTSHHPSWVNGGVRRNDSTPLRLSHVTPAPLPGASGPARWSIT